MGFFVNMDYLLTNKLANRWRKSQEAESFLPEAFLKEHEKYYVNACARFRNLNYFQDHAWVLSAGNDMRAMILHSKQTIFPVFGGYNKFNFPDYLLRSLKNINISALHGLAKETETLEEILLPLGFKAVEYMNYYLMAVDPTNEVRLIKTPPTGLILRHPVKSDLKKLLPLQLAYEREEVLPAGALVDKKVCALNLGRILSKEKILVAELDGELVGKINTNAEGYSRYQVGGVYVSPKHRSKGIGSFMTAAFVRLLLAAGKGVTLFVRKKNNAAISVYLSTGFKNIADYRIVYMQQSA